MPLGGAGGQNVEHPRTLVSLSSVFFFFVLFLFFVLFCFLFVCFFVVLFCFSFFFLFLSNTFELYWHGAISASYAVLRQLLLRITRWPSAGERAVSHVGQFDKYRFMQTD